MAFWTCLDCPTSGSGDLHATGPGFLHHFQTYRHRLRLWHGVLPAGGPS